MLRRTLLFYPALIIFLSCACSRTEQSSGPPQIHFLETEHELGELAVDPNQTYPVSFTFKNRGFSPLRIEQVVSSCSCTNTHITKDHLEPGEEGQIHVSIAVEIPEERRATLAVYTNDPLNRHVKLNLSWRAVAPLEFDSYQVDFGALRPGETAERTLALVRRADERWPACNVGLPKCFPDANMQAEWIEDSASESDASPGKQLRIRVVAGEESGESKGRVIVQLTECWRPTLVIPVTWRVRDLIEAAPSMLFLGTDEPGQRPSGQIMVSADSDAELEVRDVKFKDPVEGSSVTWERQTPNSVLVHVEMRLGEEVGLQKSEIQIVCSKPVEKTVTVPISAFVRADGPGR